MAGFKHSTAALPAAPASCCAMMPKVRAPSQLLMYAALLRRPLPSQHVGMLAVQALGYVSLCVDLLPVPNPARRSDPQTLDWRPTKALQCLLASKFQITLCKLLLPPDSGC